MELGSRGRGCSTQQRADEEEPQQESGGRGFLSSKHLGSNLGFTELEKVTCLVGEVP